MLYAHDDRKSSVSLRLMVQKIVNEYGTSENTVFIKQVTTIIQDAERLHRSEISIYNIKSTFFQEIVFLSNNAPKELLENIEDMNKDRLEELLKILDQIK